MTPPDDRSWQPATFRERGVAIPFTSPMLAGARARLTERRCDIVVPHPGGARGVYIFALGSLAEFCTPSLHDLQLVERVANLRPLSPHGVRLAARAVAAEGVAGRPAAAAARAAETRDAQMVQEFEALVLQAILGQAGEAATEADPKLRTAQALLKLAQRTGRKADAVKADVERLSRLLVAAGLDARPPSHEGPALPGRNHALMEALAHMRSGMQVWAEAGDSPACAQVVRSASVILAAARHCLAAAQRTLDDPATLLDAWATAPDSVAARLCRPDWLLDGWEHLCLLWRLAETDDLKAEAAVEACLLLPPIPPESEGWFGQAPELVSQLRARPATAAARIVQPPSQAVSIIARNERIRAMAA